MCVCVYLNAQLYLTFAEVSDLIMKEAMIVSNESKHKLHSCNQETHVIKVKVSDL